MQLASQLTHCQISKLILTKGYNLTDFRNDLKEACRLAGSRGVNTVLFLTDADIAQVRWFLVGHFFHTYHNNVVLVFPFPQSALTPVKERRIHISSFNERSLASQICN